MRKFLAAATLAFAVWHGAPICPHDTRPMVFTGVTETHEGKVFHHYRCWFGHGAWVAVGGAGE